MKRIYLLAILSTIPFWSLAQTSSKNSTQSPNTQTEEILHLLSRIDTLLMTNNLLLKNKELNVALENRYKLYSTDNIYTLLQLDTATGIVTQVQWSLEAENEGEWFINSTILSLDFGAGYKSNTFELYPTKNMYQFILLDKTNGRKWHIQWGMDENKRWIRRF